MRRFMPWLAAWSGAGAPPDGEPRRAAPRPVAAALATPVEADNLTVTVQDVQLADRIAAGAWFAEGTWLVVSLDAALIESEPPKLTNVYLRVGERTFLASERVAAYDSDAALGGWGLHVGIPQTGTIVFELPDDIAADDSAATAVLQLALGTPLGNLSPQENLQGAAVIELPVDLTSVDAVSEIELPDTSWTTP